MARRSRRRHARPDLGRHGARGHGDRAGRRRHRDRRRVAGLHAARGRSRGRDAGDAGDPGERAVGAVLGGRRAAARDRQRPDGGGAAGRGERARDRVPRRSRRQRHDRRQRGTRQRELLRDVRPGRQRVRMERSPPCRRLDSRPARRFVVRRLALSAGLEHAQLQPDGREQRNRLPRGLRPRAVDGRVGRYRRGAHVHLCHAAATTPAAQPYSSGPLWKAASNSSHSRRRGPDSAGTT